MDNRKSNIFLILVLVQGLHSLEEYAGKLWDVFLPAKLLTSLVSEDLETGFLIINFGLFIFGMWCWLFPVRKNYSFATVLIWFWIIVELINGVGHPLWAFREGGYVPGLATALILLSLAIYLARLHRLEGK